MQAVTRALRDYEDDLDALGLTDADVAGHTALRGHLARRAAQLAVAGPAAATTLPANTPGFVVASLVGRLPIAPPTMATVKPMTAMVAFPAGWTWYALSGRDRRPGRVLTRYLAAQVGLAATLVVADRAEALTQGRSRVVGGPALPDSTGERCTAVQSSTPSPTPRRSRPSQVATRSRCDPDSDWSRRALESPRNVTWSAAVVAEEVLDIDDHHRRDEREAGRCQALGPGTATQAGDRPTHDGGQRRQGDQAAEQGVVAVEDHVRDACDDRHQQAPAKPAAASWISGVSARPASAVKCAANRNATK